VIFVFLTAFTGEDVMKTIMMLKIAILLIMASAASGEVSTRVQLMDSNLPLEPADPCIPYIYQDIMVGTRLSIIVSSDTGGYWNGGLLIADANRNYGVLSGRDYNDITMDYEGSRFPAANVWARVWDWQEDLKSGFVLSGDGDAIAGDWFIIDYLAATIGDCNVGVFDFDNISPELPVYEISFHQVRTRDFNGGGIVNFADLALFASYWQQTGCNEPEWCEGTDLDINGKVDANDLMLFCNYWLERAK
jgi:hypothetical protein